MGSLVLISLTTVACFELLRVNATTAETATAKPCAVRRHIPGSREHPAEAGMP